MLGIPDPWVWLVYVLCLLSELACVIYGGRRWNRGAETVPADDVRWAKEEYQLGAKL
jgi:hypothetical protein